jgi:hypothetical protein
MTRAVPIKDRAPRWAKDVANVATRQYGLLTADLRPLPDFLIAGTKRGGTTTLWNAMIRHPQTLGMFPQMRGLKSNAFFFDEGHSLRWYRSHFPTGLYRGLKARSTGPNVVGEASPYYMYGEHIPARIAATLPSVKWIILLRNPVERAYGHYQERRKQGVEPLSFAEALAAEPERLAADAARRASDPSYYSEAHDFYAYRDRGVYLPQLQRIREHFPREQVLVLRSEDLYGDPTGALNEVADFLGIGPWPGQPVKHHNLIRRSPMDDAVRADLESFYAPWNERLAEYLGIDLGW